MAIANRKPFDPTRYKNRASAKSAARNYATKGRQDRADAIRKHWKIGDYANSGNREVTEAQDASGDTGHDFHLAGADTGHGEAGAEESPEEVGFVFEVEDQESLGEEPVREEPAEVSPSPMSDREAKDLAGLFLSMLQLVAVSWSGSTQARMTKDERDMIQPALQRMLIKHVKAAKHLATFSDPVAIVMGFAMWGRRVASLKAPVAPQYHVPAPSHGDQPYEPEPVAKNHPSDIVGDVMTDDMLSFLLPGGDI